MGFSTQTARTTKDLDFTVRVAPAGRDDLLLKQIQDVGVADLGDFFTFRIGEAMMDLDGAPYGGARYPVESIMGGRIFVKFHLDVGISSSPRSFTGTRCLERRPTAECAIWSM